MEKRKQFVRSDAVYLDQKKIIRSNAFDYETPANLSSSFDTEKMSEKVTPKSQNHNATAETKRKVYQRSRKPATIMMVDVHTKDNNNDDDPRLFNDMKSFMELHPLKVKVAASTEDLLFLHESFYKMVKLRHL